jgi:hypothetical protein
MTFAHSSRWRVIIGVLLIAAAPALFASATSEPLAAGGIAALVGVVGLYLASSSRKVIVDRESRTVTQVSGWFGSRRVRHDLAGVDTVVLAVEVSSESDVYRVELGDVPVFFSVGEEVARERAVAVARHLGLGLHDKVRAKTEPPARVGETLRQRLAREGAPKEREAPAKLRCRVTREDGRIRVRVPHLGKFDRGLFLASLAIGGVLILAALHPTLLGDRPSTLEERMRFAFAMAAVPPGLFLLRRLWLSLRFTTVVVDRDGVRVGWKRVAADAITDVVSGGGGISVLWPGETVRFGDALPGEEAMWLRDEIVRALASF